MDIALSIESERRAVKFVAPCAIGPHGTSWTEVKVQNGLWSTYTCRRACGFDSFLFPSFVRQRSALSKSRKQKSMFTEIHEDKEDCEASRGGTNTEVRRA